MLESGLPLLWVRGEISNFVRATSGHWYFSLKDEQAQVRCAMFRHKNQFIDWQPKEGAQVEVLALATLYEPRGDFQLMLEKMRPAGQGALYEAFERLKRKLEQERLFDQGRKRPLPRFPERIGVVTSPQAAALRDVLTTLKRRMPAIPVILYPTQVQGEGAAHKVAQAIMLANKRAECEVLIVCRGGGSIEDLWAFNEEEVARAIAASRIPVVSGVGHETDFTIADFVADVRAATPTAAAQLVVPERNELMLRLSQLEQRMRRDASRRLDDAMQRVDFLQRRLVHPAERLLMYVGHLDRLAQRLHRAWSMDALDRQRRWRGARQRLLGLPPDFDRLGERLRFNAARHQAAMQRLLALHEERLMHKKSQLVQLDPGQVLARGYSVVFDEKGKVVTEGANLELGNRLRIRFAHGQVHAEVTDRK